MRKILSIFFCLLFANSVAATPLHRAPSNVGAQGHSVIQGLSITTSSSVNVLKAFQSFYRFGATPGNYKRNTDGYPTANCVSVACTGFFILSSASYQGMVPGDYYLYFPATMKAKFTTGTSTNCSLFSGSGGSCSGSTNATITINGTGAGIIKFTLPDDQATFVFDQNFDYTASSGTLAMVADRDRVAYNTYLGTGDAREYYSAAFLSYMQTLDSSTYRFYGDIGENVNNSIWAYRTSLTHIVWSDGYQLFPTGAWSGGANTSGALSYSATASSGCTATGGSNELYTAAATGDQPSPNPLGLLADPTMASRGLTVQAIVPVGATNVTGTPKLCWGTNAYPIYGASTGFPVGIGAIQAPASTSSDQTIVTFVFDPIINGGNGAFILFDGSSAGGVHTHPPYEVQIALANYLNMNYWMTYPYLVTDDYVTQHATLIKNTLKSALKFKPAYSNEVWNNGFYPTKYAAIAMATAMGFNISADSWYSLRTREIMGNIIPAVFTGGTLSRVERLLDLHSGDISTVLSNNGAYNERLRSDQLKAGSTGSGPASVGQVYCVYTGGTWTTSCSGGKDYTVKPNRAVDVVEAITGAPYTGGINNFYGADNCYLDCVAFAGNTAVWQAIMNQMDGISGGTIAGAIALVDDDIRQGRNLVQTFVCAAATFTTPLAHGFSVGDNLGYQVTGGTQYSGLPIGVMLAVKSTPLPTTFTAVAYANGSADTSGSAINCGTIGSGTSTIGYKGAAGAAGGNFRTVDLQYTNNVYHPWIQYLALQFQSPIDARPAGMLNLIIHEYEGSLEPGPPTFAQCSGLTSANNPVTTFTGDLLSTSSPFISNVSAADVAKLIVGMKSVTGTGITGNPTILGVYPDRAGAANTIQLSANPTGTGTAVSISATGDCSTSLNLAIFNWKKSATFAATQQLYYDQFKGRDPNMPTFNNMPNAGEPSQLVLGGTAVNANSSLVAGGNQYGLLNGNLFGISQTLKNYDGIRNFNLNYLLERDLNPASNDNSPVGAAKAA